MSHAQDDSGAPENGSARLRWASDGLVIAASLLVTVLAYLTPASGGGVALRAAATALTVVLVARLILRVRRVRLRVSPTLWGDEDQYRTFIERLPVVGYVEFWEPDNARVIMSPRIEDMLGWPPSNWTSTEQWLSMVHADDRERMLAIDTEATKTQQPFLGEYRILRKDGSVAWVRDEAALVRDAEDHPLFWQGVMVDITEQKEAQLQLQEAEKRYRALVEHIPAVTYIDAVDPLEPMHTRLVYVSPQVETMFGYRVVDWLGELDGWRNAIHPEDRERIVDDDTHANATGQTFREEYRVLTKDGSVMWVHDESVAVHDDEGHIRFWQGAMFDITARRTAQEGLERALAREQDASRALREIDAMKNTFLHAVSHELRTPLASILGFAVTLEHHQGTLPQEETQELTRRLAVNARKLDRLLSDLLDLDRLDRGIIEPKWRPTDVGALVRHVVQESDLMVERPLRIEADPVLVSVDGAKVERIVENLLANTARHTDDDTPIWIWVRAHDGGVLIVVEDAGRGVPAELRETIFRPFEQGPERSAHSPGVGIGLSLVGRFASLHGGRAWVEDRPGGGASFRVWLPDGPPASSGGPSTARHPGAGREGSMPQDPPARVASA
jgi:PAS domain S-box-containing protein